MSASGGDHRRQPPSHHTPQVSRGFQVAAALAVLALVAIVVATSSMETPPWAEPYVHSTVDMAVVAEDIVFEDVDSIDVVLPGEHQPLLWRSLASPSSSAAQCVLVADPKDRPAQQTCLFANVCVNKTERSITTFGGVRAPDVMLIPRASGGEDGISVPVTLVSSSQSFPDFVNETGAPVHHGLWVWMDRYTDYNFAHTLIDEVFGTYRMLMVQGLLDLANDIRPITDVATKSIRQYGAMTRHAPKLWSALYSSNLTHTPAAHTVCFRTLMAGAAYLGYAQSFYQEHVTPVASFPPFVEQLAGFRNTTLRHLGIPPLPTPHRMRVVIVQKGGAAQNNHRFGNFEAMVQHVRAQMPHVDIVPASWAGMSLQEQALLCWHTDMMVVIPGSDVINAMWLPDHAELLVLCRPAANCGPLTTGNEVRLWFRRYTRHLSWWCDFEIGREVQCVRTLARNATNSTPAEWYAQSHLFLPVDALVARIRAVEQRLRRSGHVP